MKKLLISSGFFALFYAGCSVMPYHDTFECNKGANTHICERVSEVYENSDNINLAKNNTQVVKQNFPVSQELVILKKDNRDLKNMIEAISYSKLQKPIEVIVVENQNKLKQTITKTNLNKPKKLNKYIKVCVANANIRVLPTCKAKVIKVVKKGTKLFALSMDKNGWIKLKDNNYIHRSVTNENCDN